MRGLRKGVGAYSAAVLFHIIPDLALLKNKAQRAGGASARGPANRLGNPLLVRKIC